MQRRPRQHDPDHLAFVRTLPCVVCGNDIETEAAHVRYGDITIAKPMTGIATKPHDMFTVPLCGEHHRQQHNHGNEREWWKFLALDPVKIALAIYAETGNFERGMQIARRGAR